MPVTFILGRAGTGKTRYCLDALLAELQQPDESRRLILLVPEQASFQMERALAIRAPRHGYWRAEVLSFSRLAQRVFDEADRGADALRPTARALALRCVIADAKEAPRAFGAAVRTAGFLAHLDRVIEELLLENVTPEELARAADGLKDTAVQRRVAALADVYRDYLDWLGPERIDPAQRLAALRERLAGLAWLGEASIWVDGFAGFTGQEVETLVALARGAREVAITLLLDPAAPAVRNTRRPPGVLNLFHRTETTYQRLVQRLTDERVELRPPLVLQPSVAPRFAQAEGLARLEAGLATPIGAGNSSSNHCSRPAEPPRASTLQRSEPQAPARGSVTYRSRSEFGHASAGQVRVLECETHRDELRAAARFIRRKVLESQGALRFRDFAVIARDLEPFARAVADVFAEYEIPYFLDRRRPLGVHALARFVQALLEAVGADFSTGSMTRLLRCGLLPLSRPQAEALENVIVANEIRGLESWQQPRWTFEPDEVLDKARVDAVAALEPLVLLARADPTPTAAAWACTLHETLAALRVPARIAAWIAEVRQAQDWETAEVHRLAWDTLCDLLEDLHDVAGEKSIELTELAAIVGSALSELTVGLAPPTLDQVLIGSVERSRHPDIKYVWVFAFNEGIFPARPAGDALLSTADRELLAEAGLAAPRPHRDEAFAERLLGYIALTRPSRGLTVSYAKVGDDGEPRFASPLLDEVRRVLPGLEVETAPEDEPPVCLSEFARGYLGVRAAKPKKPADARRYEALRVALERSPTHREQLSRLLRGMRYRNTPAAVQPYRRPKDADAGIAWDGSPSELETYLQCPFKHFALYGLSLSALRGPAPVVLELGSQAHAVLADVTRRAIAAAESVRQLSDDQWLRFLEEALSALAKRQPADLGRRRPQAAFLSAALRPFLRELVLAHAERWRRGVCEPAGCELRFAAADDECALRALELKTSAGERVRLHGYIDRLDRCVQQGRTHLLVYDYKSSPRNVKGEYLTQDRLQLFAYLLAVEQAMGDAEQTRAAGVFLAPLYPDVEVTGKKYFASASAAESRMYLYRPRGLFDAAIARLLDAQLGEHPSPVAAMQLKKDGSSYARSDALPAGELVRRLELARRTVLRVAEGIIAGRVDVAPLLENKTLACRNCEFAVLCRFEPIFNRPRVAETWLPVLGQIAADESGGGR